MSKIFKNGRLINSTNYYKDLLDKPTINGNTLEEINNTSKSLEIFQAISKADFEDPTFERNPQCVYAVIEEDAIGRTNVRFHFSNQLEATDPDYKEYIANDYKPVLELPSPTDALKEQIYFLTEGWIDPDTNLKYGIGLYGWMIVDDTTEPPTYGWRALTEVPIDNKTIYLSEDGNISSQVGGYHDTDITTLKTQSTEIITKEEATIVLQDDDYTYVTFPYTEYEQYTPRTQYTTSLFYQGSTTPTSKSTIPTNLTGNDYIQFNHDKTITVTLDKATYSSVTLSDYVMTLTWDKPLDESISYINPIYVPVNDSIVIEDGRLGVASARNAYTSIHKIDDYLYEVDYSGVNYFDAKDYFANMNPSYSSCASFKNGLYFGYNHDSIYNEEATFVVSTPTRTSRYATMSVCTGIPELTKKFVETGAYSKLYSVLPHMVKSGVNVKGLVASTHTVLLPPGATATTVTVPDVEEEKRFCALQLARYALDRFETAKEAAEYIRDYVAVYMPKNFQDEGYEVSIVIADAAKIYSVEFVDNKNEIREISSSPIYTNYYKSLTTINTDGSLYGPKDVPAHTPSVENTLKANSQGIERHNSLNADYDPAALFNNPTQMRASLSNILYTKVYDLTNEFYTDYTGVGSLTVDSAAADYTGSADVAAIIAKYTARSRDPEDANYGTKHTSHSSVFDIKSLKLYLTSQEGSTNYEFALPFESDGDEDYILGPISDTSIDSSQNTVLQQILNDIFNSNKTLVINYNNEDHIMTSNEEKEDDSGHYLSFASVLNRTYTMIKVYYNDTDKTIIGARRYKVYPIQYSLADVGEGSFLPTGNIIAVCDDYRRITVTAVEGFKASLVNGWKGDGTVEYSFDRENWTAWDGTTVVEVTTLNPYGLYEVNFRGVGNTYISTETEQTQFKFTTLDDSETRDIGLEVKNNPTYLLDYTINAIADSTDLFNSLFKDCKLISRASAIILPYVSIGIRSYKDMFSGCSQLTVGPTIPAETLMEESCAGMFRDCTALVAAPALAPTEMDKACYKEMFMGCASLVFPDPTTPYTLPADKLAESCYEGMFKGCTSITYAPALEGGVVFGIPDKAYANMFENCTGLTVGPSELSAITIGNHAYDSMFKGCTGMVTAIDTIPATNLGEYAMASMFEGCTHLEEHPKIVATLLTPYACQAMFKGCEALKDPVYIPKFSVFDDHSCTEMYMNCGSLTYPMYIEEGCTFNGTLPVTDSMYKNCTKIVWYNAGEAYKINVPDDRFGDMFTGTNYRDSVSQVPKDNVNYYYLKPKIDNCLIIKPNDMTGNASAFNITFNTGFVRKTTVPDPNYGHMYYTILPNDNPVWEHITDSIIAVAADKYIAICCNLRKTNGVNLIKVIDQDIKVEGSLDGFASVPMKAADPGVDYDVYTFENLFANCNKLISAKDLKYNEKLLKVGMYKNLFGGSSIVTAPTEEFNYSETDEIYMSMFKNCASLTTIPKFKEGTNIGKQSCYEMFMGTTTLTTVPFDSVGTDTIGEEGCLSMFEASGLTTVLKTPATNLNKGCYKRMFANSEVNSFLANSKIFSNINEIPEDGCMEMFKECTKLTFVSEEYLEQVSKCGKYGCYNMFADCTSLTRANKVAFEEVGEYGCGGMFKNCTALVNIPASFTFNNVDEKGCFEMYFNTGIKKSPAISVGTASGDSALASIFEGCKEIEEASAISVTTNESDKLLSRAFYGCTKLVDAPIITNSTITDYCYEYMFFGCTALTGAPALPAMEVGKYSYSYMFHGCTALETPPALPATTLAEACYRNIFTGCEALETAPELPATTLAKGCYWSMFMNCIALTVAPVLAAETLVESCYRNMFGGCKALIECPENPAKTLAPYCCYEMFTGCTTLIAPATLSTEIMAEYCYQQMFYNCSGIYWYSTGADYRLPSEGTGVAATNWNTNMFSGNSGSSIPTSPTINTTYYYVANAEFTFETTSNDAVVKNTTAFALKYSVDDGVTWTNLAVGSSTPAAGKVIIKGPIVSEFNSTQADNKGLYVTGTSVKVSGEIPKKMKYNGLFAHSTGLVDASGLLFPEECGRYRGMFYKCTSLTTAPELPATTLAANCYDNMFAYCTKLTTAPELPATTLATYCYYCMFYGCTSLTTIPSILPATNLTGCSYCYANMFYNCTSLTATPELPATQLATYCYAYMFQGCTSLTTAPELPATTLATYCYYYMFQGCTSLTTPPELPATTLADYCYGYMFYSCSKLKTAPELPATTLKYACYVEMFWKCYALEKAPELPATTLATYCYNWMFESCTGLKAPVKLPATTMYQGCYANMFNGCSGITWASTGTPYRLPTSGSGSTATDWSSGMFNGNSGTLPGSGSPSINTTYYYIPETTLTFESDSNNVVITNNLTIALKYSKDNGTTWTNLPVNGTTGSGVGKILIKGTINQASASTSNVVGIAGTDVKVSGELQCSDYRYLFYRQTALKDASGLIGSTTLIGYCYFYMFYKCTSLTTPPELPATTLASYCYRYMFQGCTSLATAPELPATTLVTYCYDHMFHSCTSLTTAPELPATQLAAHCYEYMFYGCTSLTTPPTILPATTLAEECCYYMFQGCTSLTTAPELPATTLADYCYLGMFSDCTALKTPPALPATSLSKLCYHSMFENCKALKAPVKLPATTMANQCYQNMFQNCSGITWYSSGAPYRLPTSGSGTTASSWSSNMFSGNSGTSIPTTPSINTTYYYLPDYITLTFENESSSVSDVTIKPGYSYPSLQYSIDGGTTWTSMSTSTTTPAAHKTMVRGYIYGGTTTGFNITGTGVKVSGELGKYTDYNYLFYNQAALKDASGLIFPSEYAKSYECMFEGCTSLTTPPELPATTLTKSCYNSMFYGCTSLTSAPELPATTIGAYCYSSMFQGCTSLTTAPELPATNLTRCNYCYDAMFKDCTALTTPPALPATTLTEGCYQQMFQNCASLTTPPELPATTLKAWCYYEMFSNCTSLTAAPALPATIMQQTCYAYMFQDCTSLTTPPELPATTLASYCYRYMFQGCTSLTTAPELPATTLKAYCYANMFYNCSKLKTAPELPATTLADHCYYQMFYGTSLKTPIKLPATTMYQGCYANMFYGCTGIYWASSGTAYRLPTTGSGSTATDWSYYMFGGNSGTSVPTTPSINTTYYYLPETTIDLVDTMATNANSDMVIVNNLARSIEYMRDDNGTWQTLASGESTEGQVIINKITVKGRLFGESSSTSLKITAKSGGNAAVKVSGELGKGTAYNYLFYGSDKLVDASGLVFPEECGIYQGMFIGCTSLTIPPQLPATTLAESCYYYMFQGCTSLTTAPELPATTLASYCYRYMFYGCTSLTTAPELPATQLATYCYAYMFQGCTSLTTPPELPATTLATYCYYYMFQGCTSLTTPPELPATTLATYCYYYMFQGCISLTTAPELPATTLADYCYGYMFYGCTSLTTAPELPATTLASNCYKYMFYGCKSLTTPPTILPATTLAGYCYYGMFQNCKALKAPVKLPATTMYNYCYTYMFQNCSGITWASTGTPYRLPTSGGGSTATDWSTNMFYGNSGSSVPSTPSINTTYYYIEQSTLTFTSNTSAVGLTNNLGYSIRYAITDAGVEPTAWTALANGETISADTNKVLTIKAGIYVDAANKLVVTGTNVKLGGTLAASGRYSYLFKGCTALTDVSGLEFPTNLTVTYYARGMFEDCTNLVNGGTILSSGTLTDYCFNGLFYNCTNLTTPPTLPAKTMKLDCYRDMFKGCSSLATTPELPATTLAQGCYEGLFCGTIIEEPPYLPAVSTYQYCYAWMFQATPIKTAPDLPATSVASYAYQNMFQDCTSLEEVPEILATSINTYGCKNMFVGCTSLKTSRGDILATSFSDYSCQYMFDGCTLLTSPPNFNIKSVGVSAFEGAFRNCISIEIPNSIDITSASTNCFKEMYKGCSSILWSDSGAEYRIPTKGSISQAASTFMTDMFTGCGGAPIPVNKETTYYCNGVKTTLKLEGSDYKVKNLLGHRAYYRFNTTDEWEVIGDGSSVSFTQPVYIRGDLSGTSTASETRSLVVTGNTVDVKVSGDLLESVTYKYAFAGSTGIVDISGLNFPEKAGNYRGMFKDCTNLVTTPLVLPATANLTEYVYANMFQGCTSLIQCPTINAQTLSASCCESMYEGCTSIIDPIVPNAITLAVSCYKNMFKGCTSITVPAYLPATSIPNYAYEGMFQDCNKITWSTVGVPYRMPNMFNSTGSVGTDSLKNMFANNSGVLPGSTGTPVINTTYYYSGPMTTLEFEGTNVVITNNSKLSLQYTSGTSAWTTLAVGSSTPAASKVKVRGYFEPNSDKCLTVGGTNVSVSGILQPNQNYSYLFNGSTGLVDAGDLIFPDECNCYRYMFHGCTSLTTPPELPATTLKAWCYYDMFSNCTSLTAAPELPATTLAYYCYGYIFYSCTSLTTAPELPATILANYCYYCMFYNCTSLTTAPQLPATQLAQYCYGFMFATCTSLTTPPILPATTLAYACYYYMFNACTKLKTIPSLPARILPDRCYYYMFYNCNQFVWGSGTSFYISADQTTSEWNTNMFMNNSGTLPGSGSPSANTNYYYQYNNAPNITLTFEGTNVYITNNTANALSYRKDGASSWSTLSVGSSTSTGSKIEINGKVITVNGGGLKVFGSNVKVKGNLPGGINYEYLFYNSPGLTDASGLIFPEECARYMSMFYGCTKLTTPPTLPATTLTDWCYRNMFYGCSSLTTPPELPATQLTESCYRNMFQNCTSLKNIPALTASKLATYCYYYMFYGCNFTWTSTVTSDKFKINYTGTETTRPTYWNTYMFGNNIGKLPEGGGSPKVNTEYYLYKGIQENYIMFTSTDGSGTITITNNSYTTKTYYDQNMNSYTLSPNSSNSGYKAIFVKNVDLLSFYIKCTTKTMKVIGKLAANQTYSSCFKGNSSLKDASELFFPATTLTERCYASMFENCTSLTTPPTTLPATTLAEHCYDNMFSNCTSLTTAPELPATQLADYCYNSIFENCTSLKTPPALPATTLASGCYAGMFCDCTSLTTAPALPATTLPVECYHMMFYGCKSLTTAPELPATTLAHHCCYSMFYGCTSLTTAPELPATTLADHCYHNMFRGCISLTTAPELPATTLAVCCYYHMFQGCTSLKAPVKLPARILPDYCYSEMFRDCSGITWTALPKKAYRLPASGFGIGGEGWSSYMFKDNSGTSVMSNGTPKINTTYYYK